LELNDLSAILKFGGKCLLIPVQPRKYNLAYLQ